MMDHIPRLENGTDVLCMQMKRSSIYRTDDRFQWTSNRKQEAQLLLGDRVTRKHAKDS